MQTTSDSIGNDGLGRLTRFERIGTAVLSTCGGDLGGNEIRRADFSDEELAVVDKLIDALAGLSYSEAEFILKATISGLKEVAIIKGTFDGRSEI